MMEQNNWDRFCNDIATMDNNELSTYLNKQILIGSFVKEDKQEEFLSMLLSLIRDGYIEEALNGSLSRYTQTKSKLFKDADRYNRRKLITNKINFLEKEEFVYYLKDILAGKNGDSCVLYMDYDIEFFAEMTHTVLSPPRFLGGVQYLSSVLLSIEKKPNLVAILFGFHCERNEIWIQSSVEIKQKIYNILK